MFKQLVIMDFIDYDNSRIEYTTIIDGVLVKVSPKTIIIDSINIILDFESEVDPISNISYFRVNNTKTIIFIPIEKWEVLNRV